MIKKQRTATEIYEYCEAASKGWHRGDGARAIDASFEGRRDTLVANFGGCTWSGDEGRDKTRRYREQSKRNMTLAINARTDLPYVLKATVTERNVLSVLEEMGRKISLLVSGRARPTRSEIVGFDDALMEAGAVLNETKWLEEDTDGNTRENLFAD